MDKRKITIEKIENEDERRVVFSKKRKELFEEAAGICRESNVDNIALIVFSPDGKPYSFGPVDDCIDKFFTGTQEEKENKKMGTDHLIQEEEEEEEDEEEEEKTDDRDDQRRFGGDGGGEGDGFWWDNIDMDKLDSIEKVQAVKNALLGLQQNVRKRIDELTASSSSSTAAADWFSSRNNSSNSY